MIARKYISATITLLFMYLMTGSSPAQIPAPRQGGPVALAGGTVVTVSGDIIYGGTVVFEDGIITAIGTDAAIPEGAEIMDVTGKFVLTQDFKGFVLKNEIKGIEVVTETLEEVILKVGGGEVWHDFVLYCISNNWGGVENLSLIPGTVGAAPIQNIGAYGVEQQDVFVKLEALNLLSKEVEEFDSERCNFGYRDSFFKKWGKGNYVILNVFYKLAKANYELNTSYGDIEAQLITDKIDRPTLNDVSNAVIKIRKSKLPDPQTIGNSGSFFKNPVVSKELFNTILADYPDAKSYPINHTQVKLPAGWLIEKAGWKGSTFDNRYGVHKNQSLVLVNYGGAKGKELKELALNIIRDIEMKFKVKLEAEVNIL